MSLGVVYNECHRGRAASTEHEGSPLGLDISHEELIENLAGGFCQREGGLAERILALIVYLAPTTGSFLALDVPDGEKEKCGEGNDPDDCCGSDGCSTTAPRGSLGSERDRVFACGMRMSRWDGRHVEAF